MKNEEILLRLVFLFCFFLFFFLMEIAPFIGFTFLQLLRIISLLVDHEYKVALHIIFLSAHTFTALKVCIDASRDTE